MTLDEAKAFGIIYHHKFLVMQYLVSIIQELMKRAEEHDNSKFSEAEFPGLVKLMDTLDKCSYGTPEHDEVRKKYAATFEAHYKKNRHHPEHHANGIEDMTLIDLIEMLVDWKAASMRTTGTIENSIKIGAERFNIPPVLVKILDNTAKAYKM